MDERERCPKYPSMLKTYCSHCQGSERGTTDNPRFSLKEAFDHVHGYPVVEVLKNGGPVHRYDSHFRFGRRKAEMLVVCLPVLREFGWSTDDEMLEFKPRLIIDRRRGLRVQIYVQMHPDFEYSTGATVERPWLCLQAMVPDNHHIGLGMMKCRAICAVEKDLNDWLRNERIRM